MSQLSRRRFLEDSLFATLAGLAASSATNLLAQEVKRPVGPNEKLSVAVIGCKGRGSAHISALAGQADTQVTYICDVDEQIGKQRADGVAKLQGLAPKWVKDMRHVFDDPSVDIVTTATPNHWHSLCAIWAMQAGKDVYVEKPVSHNVSEGRRVVEAARKHPWPRAPRWRRRSFSHNRRSRRPRLPAVRGSSLRPTGLPVCAAASPRTRACRRAGPSCSAARMNSRMPSSLPSRTQTVSSAQTLTIPR